MNLKNLLSAIQTKNARDLENAKNHPTYTDLMKEQKGANVVPNPVHRRRDLDSLG